MIVIEGAVILCAFVAILAALIWVNILAVKEDDDSYFVDMTPEELAEERYKYACYEDTEIEN